MVASYYGRHKTDYPISIYNYYKRINMSFEIFTEGGGEIRIYQPSEQDAIGNSILFDDQLVAEGDYGKSVFYHFSHHDFSIWYSEYMPAIDTVLLGRADESALELRIALQNKIVGTWEGIAEAALEPSQFNLSFTSHVKTRAIFKAGCCYKTFDIHFKKEFLFELAKDFPRLDGFLLRVEKDLSSSITKQSYFCTPEMIRTVKRILQHRYRKETLKHMLEYAVKGILIDALDTIDTEEDKKSHFKPSARDIEGLYEAKRLIELQPIDQPLSIHQLCRKTGLNDFKLKKGFKALFNIAPYGYHVQIKMEEGRRLLLDTDQTVKEVAYTLGYHHGSNFTIEFKKRFGVAPKYFKTHGRK